MNLSAIDIHDVVLYFILSPALAILVICYLWQLKSKSVAKSTPEKGLSPALEEKELSPPQSHHLDFPSPSDLEAQRTISKNLKDHESRIAFLSALSIVKGCCLYAIERQYVQDHDDSIIVSLPMEMWKRKDLIDSELLPWLKDRGWAARHRWGNLSDNYYLYISPR